MLRSALVQVGPVVLLSIVPSIALFYLGGTEDLAVALPLASCAVASSLLVLIASALYSDVRWPFPRQARLKRSLELAAFWLLQADKLKRDWLLSRLRDAERAATGAIRSKLSELVVRFSELPSAEVPQLASEVETCLRNLPRGLRRPSLRFAPGYPSTRFFLALSVFVALLGQLAFKIADKNLVYSLRDSMLLLLVWVLAFYFLRLVGVLMSIVNDFAAKPRFQCVLLTDKAGDPLNVMAEHFYSRIGRLYLIAIGDESPTAIVERGGYELVLVERAHWEQAFTVLGMHADLVVLNTEDPALAARARDLTDLPADRRFALSRDGHGPTGFTWIEPSSLRMDPRKSGLVPTDVQLPDYALSTIPGRGALQRVAVQLGGIGVFGLVWVDNSGPLICLCLLAIVGIAYQEVFGPVRRRAHSRTVLRAPRFPRFSYELEPKSLNWKLTAVVFILTAGAFWYMASVHVISLYGDEMGATGMSATDFVMLFMLACVLFGVVLLTYLGLAGGALVGAKWLLDWNFRTCVFRRNSRKFGYGHKVVILVKCGKYGQVLIVDDDTINQTDEDFGEWRESSQGPWFEVFSEIKRALDPATILHDWRRQVVMELEIADFAVFDWAEDVTENMVWELEMAIYHLPVHRILVVHSEENANDVARVLESAASGAGSPIRCLEVARGRDDEYIWANHRDLDQAFSEALHEMMSALRDEDRHYTRTLQPGSWPVPLA
jgi:hypothetical protein